MAHCCSCSPLPEQAFSGNREHKSLAILTERESAKKTLSKQLQNSDSVKNRSLLSAFEDNFRFSE